MSGRRSHWLLDLVESNRYAAMLTLESNPNLDLIRSVLTALEIAIVEIAMERDRDAETEKMLCDAAQDAFCLCRPLADVGEPMQRGKTMLLASCFAALADRGSEAAQWICDLEDDGDWPALPINSENWGERVWATLIDAWLRLVKHQRRREGYRVSQRIADLRRNQTSLEGEYLAGLSEQVAKGTAVELIGLYHVLKVADILAHSAMGDVDDSQVQRLVDVHFECALSACRLVRLLELEPMTRLLAAAWVGVAKGLEVKV